MPRTQALPLVYPAAVVYHSSARRSFNFVRRPISYAYALKRKENLPSENVEQRKHSARIPGIPGITGFSHTLRMQATGFPAHTHPGDMEIVYIAKGELDWWASGELHPLHADEIYVTFPDEPHGSSGDLCAPSELYWLTLELSPWRGIGSLTDAAARELRAALLALPRRRFITSPMLRQLFIRTVGRLQEISVTNIPAGDCGVWLAALLWETVACAAATSNTQTPSPEIAGVLNWLEQRLDNSVGVADMAAHAGFSVSFFKEKFLHEVGLAPGKYYLRRRVRAAARDIVNSDCPLVEIALSYGFSSSQYLTTCLRREIGKSPTQLRQTAPRHEK